MRRSRIARETSKLFNSVSSSTRRSSTRPSRQSAQGGNGESTAPHANSADDTRVKTETGGDDLVGKSMTLLPASRKRKREVGSPETSPASVSSPKSTARTTVKVEEKTVTPKRVKKARKQPAKKVKREDGQVEIHAPPNWQEVYDTVREMRKTIVAPVDTMGCETLAQEEISPRASELV